MFIPSVILYLLLYIGTSLPDTVGVTLQA